MAAWVHVAWLQLLAVFCAGVCSNSIYLCFSAITDETAKWFDVSPGAVDALASLGNVAALVGYPLASLVIDSYALAVPYCLGVLIPAVGCGLRVFGAIMKSFWAFGAGQFIVNVGCCFVNVMPVPLAVRSFPARRQGLVSAIAQIGVDLGCFGAPAFGRLFRYTPAQLLQVQLLASLLLLPSMLLFVKHGNPNADSGSSHRTHSCGNLRWRTGRLFQVRGMILLFTGRIIFQALGDTFSGLVEQLACAVPGLSVSSLSNVIMACVIAGELLAGPACDCISVKPVLGVSYMTAATGWLICLFSWDSLAPLPMTFAGLVMLFFGTGVSAVSSYLAAAQPVPELSGTASAHMHSGACIATALSQLGSAYVLGGSGCDVKKARVFMLGWTCSAWMAAFMLLGAVSRLPKHSSFNTGQLPLRLHAGAGCTASD